MKPDYKELVSEFFDFLLKSELKIDPVQSGGGIIGSKISFDFSEEEEKEGEKSSLDLRINLLIDGEVATYFRHYVPPTSVEINKEQCLSRLRQNVFSQLFVKGIHNCIRTSQKYK